MCFVLWCCCVCREACECAPGTAPPVVQSSLALLQIQSEQLQGEPLTLSDQLLWKLDTSNLTGRETGLPTRECDKPLLCFWNFFFLPIFITRQSWMYADLNCTCFCTKQMLTADASVVWVYKCLCSLLNVLVLRLLEIGFKRVYFIQTGGFGSTRDECFQTSPGKCCCVQVRFCCGTMSCQSKQIHWDVLAFQRRLNVKRKQHKSKRSVWINWDRKICQTKLLYLHGPWLPTRGSLVSFAFHEVAVVSLSDVCWKYGSIRVLLQS